MKISRQELYNLVWAEPMISICKRFGLTDNGLRKQCKSMDIPNPPVGYWSKLKHGKKAEIIPLPKESNSERIMVKSPKTWQKPSKNEKTT